MKPVHGGLILLERVVAQVAAVAPGFRRIAGVRQVQEGGIPALGADQGVGQRLVRNGVGMGINPFDGHVIIGSGLVDHRYHPAFLIARTGKFIEEHIIRYGCGKAVLLREHRVP